MIDDDPAVHDGTRVLAQAATVDPRRQGELLIPAIEKVLAEAGADRASLTAVVAGAGPGPYTGLRIGLVTARVLASDVAMSAIAISAASVGRSTCADRSTLWIAGGGSARCGVNAAAQAINVKQSTSP